MNTPTKITVVRICLIPAFVAAYLITAMPFKIVAAGLFALAALTDWLDGHIARKQNLVTDLGKFLDPIADKLLVESALILIILDVAGIYAVAFALTAIIIIARELVVSCFRVIAASKGVTLAADKLGKIKTVLQLIALLLLIPVPNISELSKALGSIVFYVGFGFLCAATLMTLVSGANYIIRNRGVLK